MEQRTTARRDPRRFPAAAITAAATLIALLASGCSHPDRDGAGDAGAAPPATALILISIDTLRADRLGAYGYERETSPHLDALARESVRFETVLAQSAFTLISHKSLLAGKYPLRLIHERTGANLDALGTVKSPHDFLVSVFGSADVPLQVEGLRARGYRTAAFTDGVWMSGQLGFGRGFETYNDRGGHLAGILPRVRRWLEDHRDDRFFLFIHTYDTHSPYSAGEPFDSMFCRDHSGHVSLHDRCNQVDCGAEPLMKISLEPADLQAISDHYDGGIAAADAHLGRLMADLRDLGRYDDALIVVTSDHGESLGEHGQVGHGGLYLEQLLVPLLVKFPPRSWNIEPATISHPVELVDVMPTIYEASGGPGAEDLDGRSVMPLIRGTASGRPHLFAQTTHEEGRDSVTNPSKRAVLEPGRWLLIHDHRAESVELFDLRNDPRGLTPAQAHPSAAAEELLGSLAALDVAGASTGIDVPERPELSEDLERQLRSLGYVGD